MGFLKYWTSSNILHTGPLSEIVDCWLSEQSLSTRQEALQRCIAVTDDDLLAFSTQVISIVMDTFTDVDIFKEVVDASFRGVPVYILLDELNLKSFLAMAESQDIKIQQLRVGLRPERLIFSISITNEWLPSILYCCSHRSQGHAALLDLN